MKRRHQIKTYILILSSILLVQCERNYNVEIKGTYPAKAGNTLKAELLNINQTQFIDSVSISNAGKFQFRFNLKYPELVLIKNDSSKYLSLLVFPGDRISVDIKGHNFSSDYVLNGSEESEKIRDLVKNVNHTRFELDSLSKAYNLLENKDSPEADVLVQAYKKVIQNQKRNNIRFIIENLSSLSSVYALYQKINPDLYVLNDLRDLQFFKIVADSMKVKYPGSTLTKSLVEDVSRRLQDYNNVVAISKLNDKQAITETGLIELNIPDTEDEKVSLSSLKGKVVLVNFWASWDSKSRQSTNSLKSIYEKYHPLGFDIYSVGLENNLINWRTAIDFEEYNWINVSELSYPYSYAANAYNVKELPTNYLINREGVVVAKNIYGKTLTVWLDNLLE